MSLYTLEPFLDDIASFFEQAIPDVEGSQRRIRGQNSRPRRPHPALDVQKNTEQNVVTAILEIPGVSKEDIAIDVDTVNRRLVVSGEKKVDANLDEKGFVHRERPTGHFSRTVVLPVGIKPTDINARFENGVSAITFPKTTPEQAPKRIDIK